MNPRPRDMKKEDIPHLLLWEQRFFPHPWNERDFACELLLQDRFCRVLEGNGDILAYACTRQVPDGFEILKIASHPDFQRKGFAGLLLEEVFSLSSKAEYSDIFLEVAVNNEKALRFYKKYGFTVLGTRKAYYPGGLDALNLVKKL